MVQQSCNAVYKAAEARMEYRDRRLLYSTLFPRIQLALTAKAIKFARWPFYDNNTNTVQ